MNLKILSFNGRGQNKSDSIRFLRNYISSIPHLDIVCLQEHKLRLSDVENLNRYLRPCAKAWILDASQGYNNAGLDPGVGCGGISILLDKKWEKFVINSGLVMGNQAQYIVLQGLFGGNLGILNTYTLNNTAHRTHL